MGGVGVEVMLPQQLLFPLPSPPHEPSTYFQITPP